ncbi:hypothetical protein ACFQ0B_07715 [Nonomuraea thailandensis]
MHKSRFFSGIALLALSASGCALAAASPEPDVVVPAEPTAIDFVDPATVIGLSTRTVTEGDSPGSGYVHIDYPEFAGATALNRELRAQAERQLGDFRARNRGVEPVSPRPELNVDWQLAAASPRPSRCGCAPASSRASAGPTPRARSGSTPAPGRRPGPPGCWTSTPRWSGWRSWSGSGSRSAGTRSSATP